MEESRTCTVCGDKAHAVNFNVLTCESCKAFFRRNALSPEDHQCAFEKKCPITVSTRKRCRSCRLQKCFEVGMLKEYIMSDDERIRKQKLVQENRAVRASMIRQADEVGGLTMRDTRSGFSEANRYPESTRHESTSIAPQMIDISASRADSEEYISISRTVLDSLIFEAHKRKSIPSTNLSLSPHQNHHDFFCPFGSGINIRQIQYPGLAEIMEAPDDEAGNSKKSRSDRYNQSLISISQAMRQEFIRKMLEDSPIGINVGLSATKLIHLNGLKEAFRVMYDRYSFGESLACTSATKLCGERKPLGNMGMMPLTDVMIRYDDLIRRLVKFCSLAPAFRFLSPMDQVNLVKGAIEDLMMFRGIHAFSPESDGWKHTDPLGTPTPMGILKYCKGNVYGMWHKMLQRFPRSFVDDDNIFLSILMLILFNPDTPNVDSVSVRIIRDFYHNMLHQYLTSTYGYERGTKLLFEVASHMTQVRHVSSTIVLNVVLELDPNDMKPLLIEAFGF